MGRCVAVEAILHLVADAPSGVITISDVLQATATKAVIEPGRYRLQINADNPIEPALIDFVLARC
jgi:hypothetical protein